MGKDKRAWRKLVKKLRRKRKRQLEAYLLTTTKQSEEYVGETEDDDKADEFNEDEEDKELDSSLFLSKEEWECREEQIELDNKMKMIERERLEEIEKENQRKIREEWEEKLRQEAKKKEEKEQLEKIMKEKQVERLGFVLEADFNEFLGFLSGDIETPPTRYLMPETSADLRDGDPEDVCYYFGKTAACRFGDRCTKLHPRPTLSTAILIPNFFTHFKLEHSVRDEYDTDLGLEYDDKELYKEFVEFYEDVVPELRKSGSLIQFKVCCNLEPHLRGNVYIQYQTIRDAVEAFRKFNGRFYNGKQLSLQFIKMDSWRSAICGAFLRKACAKGRTCGFLHVFRNPTKEFVQADRDWKETIIRRNQPWANNINKPGFTSNSEAKNSEVESSQTDSSKHNARHINNSEIIDSGNGGPIFSSADSSSIQRDSSPLSKSSSHKREKHSKKKKRKRSSSHDFKKHKKHKKEKKKHKKHSKKSPTKKY